MAKGLKAKVGPRSEVDDPSMFCTDTQGPGEEGRPLGSDCLYPRGEKAVAERRATFPRSVCELPKSGICGLGVSLPPIPTVLDD